MTVRLQREDFDVGAEILALTQGRTDIGAVATFTGICRDDGIVAMTLEHYPGMAEAEISRHVEEAEKRWPPGAIHRRSKRPKRRSTATPMRSRRFGARVLRWVCP